MDSPHHIMLVSFQVSAKQASMMKLFLLTFACMMCTISMAWGCVCNGGPCWEARQAVTPGPGGETRQPGTPGPGGRPGLGFRQETRMVAGIEASLMRPMPVVPLGRPVGPVVSFYSACILVVVLRG